MINKNKGKYFLDMVGVRGSIPLAPTISTLPKSLGPSDRVAAGAIAC